MSVLQVGTIEPTLAKALAVKYQALQLPDDSSSDAFLAEHAASVTAIVSSGPPGVDADLMRALPNLGAIVHQGAGYETIDVDTARRLGIGVSNTPDVLNATVADAAVGLMLATMRGLCVADRQGARRRLASQRQPLHLGPRRERIAGRHPGPWPHRFGDRRAAGRLRL